MEYSGKFKIGDHILFVDEPGMSFEVLATKEQSHIAIDGSIHKPQINFHYLLRALDQVKTFEPYRNAWESQLSDLH